MQAIQLTHGQVLAVADCRCSWRQGLLGCANAAVLLRYAIIILLFCCDLLQLATANDHVGVLLGLQVMNWLLQVVLLRMARCASKCHYSFLRALCHFICCSLSFEK